MSSKIIFNIPTPIQALVHPLYTDKDVEVYMKREDLIHPEISGNKWRKLKYNIKRAQEEKKGILTFGGAFSNHIYATAQAAKYFELPSIGIIRGSYVDTNNPTLHAATEAGMELQLVSHDVYKLKEEPNHLSRLQEDYPNYLIIPEGGNNDLALLGVAELGKEIVESALVPDLITVSAGTATTAKGLLASIPSASRLCVFSSLKGEFLRERLETEENTNWELNTSAHFGGYARVNAELIQFINQYYKQTNIQLDPIYTGKMVYGLHTILEQNKISKGSKILIIHTGGLQGIQGHNLRYKDKENLIINTKKMA